MLKYWLVFGLTQTLSILDGFTAKSGKYSVDTALATGNYQLADWRTGGLENWRTGELADWRTGELVN